jgi:hypothetical protein
LRLEFPPVSSSSLSPDIERVAMTKAAQAEPAHSQRLACQQRVTKPMQGRAAMMTAAASGRYWTLVQHAWPTLAV